MKTNVKTKTESIKIRVNKQEKEKLKGLADAANESLSSYLLKRGLSTDKDYQNLIPTSVELTNILNIICLEINTCNDEQLKNYTKNLLDKEGFYGKCNPRKANQ